MNEDQTERAEIVFNDLMRGQSSGARKLLARAVPILNHHHVRTIRWDFERRSGRTYEITENLRVKQGDFTRFGPPERHLLDELFKVLVDTCVSPIAGARGQIAIDVETGSLKVVTTLVDE